MEIAHQIKEYRKSHQLSQEELAEKVYVSRQTISNWETEKSYPDLQSLVLLSQCFGISLDQLIKGDLEKMKTIIRESDIQELEKATRYMIMSLLALLVFVFPAFYYLGWWGLFVYLPLSAVGIYFANRVEAIKKDYQLKTYRQIVAFSQGELLDDLETIAETAKAPYQKPLIFLLFTISFALLALGIAHLYIWLLP